MDIPLKIERIILQYIAGVVFALGACIFTYELCFLFDELAESTLGIYPITYNGVMLLIWFLAFPIGTLLGICFVDTMIFKSPGYDAIGVAIALTMNIPGVFLVGLMIALLGLSPTVLGVNADELWYTLMAVFFPLIGYNSALFYKSKLKARDKGLDREEPQVSTGIKTKEKATKRTSWLAISSAICLFGAIPLYGLFSLRIRAQMDLGLTGFFSGLFCAVTFFLGSLAVLVIALRHSKLKGTSYAILAILLSVFPLYETCGEWYVIKARAERQKAVGGFYNLQMLGEALVQYEEKNNGYLPVADRWCDFLMECNPNLKEQNFRHPKAGKFGYPIGDCHFGFNENLSGLRLADIPSDIVLLFEADGDWNLSGGPELLETRRSSHGIRHELIYVLLADGTIESYLYKYKAIKKPYFSFGLPIVEQPRWKP